MVRPLRTLPPNPDHPDPRPLPTHRRSHRGFFLQPPASRRSRPEARPPAYRRRFPSPHFPRLTSPVRHPSRFPSITSTPRVFVSALAPRLCDTTGSCPSPRRRARASPNRASPARPARPRALPAQTHARRARLRSRRDAPRGGGAARARPPREGVPFPRVGGVSVLSLGKVDARDGYHDETHIYPVGYKTRWTNADKSAMFFSEIFAGGEARATPRARVSRDADAPPSGPTGPPRGVGTARRRGMHEPGRVGEDGVRVQRQPDPWTPADATADATDRDARVRQRGERGSFCLDDVAVSPRSSATRSWTCRARVPILRTARHVDGRVRDARARRVAEASREILRCMKEAAAWRDAARTLRARGGGEEAREERGAASAAEKSKMRAEAEARRRAEREAREAQRERDKAEREAQKAKEKAEREAQRERERRSATRKRRGESRARRASRGGGGTARARARGGEGGQGGGQGGGRRSASVARRRRRRRRDWPRLKNARRRVGSSDTRPADPTPTPADADADARAGPAAPRPRRAVSGPSLPLPNSRAISSRFGGSSIGSATRSSPSPNLATATATATATAAPTRRGRRP